jgi:heme-degrading monooxygenase HmoA
MAVLVTADVQGQTEEIYDGMIAVLGDAIRQAKGFIAHFAVPSGNEWKVMELWETQDDANQFFAKHVHPNLPPGIKPKRSFQPLHSLIRG